jgi:dTDP-4-dehydrorhamnose reductase
MKYLIIGSEGLVGSRFVQLKKDEVALTPSIKECDITKEESVKGYFKKNKDKFDVVVNFAAYTDVDGAEKQKGNESASAWIINVEGAKNVAKACKELDKFLIHISTDFVFPATEKNQGPYKEDAPTPQDPDEISWYGWTKLQGEKEVAKVLDEVAVVRIAFPYYPQKYELKKDFVKKLLELYDTGKLYPLFEDMVISPLYVDDLVKVIEAISEKKLPGIYHCTSSDTVTFWEFGDYLFKKARGAKESPKKSSMKEYLEKEGITKRPRIGGFDTEKTQETLGVKLRTWRQGIDDFVRLS